MVKTEIEEKSKKLLEVLGKWEFDLLFCVTCYILLPKFVWFQLLISLYLLLFSFQIIICSLPSSSLEDFEEMEGKLGCFLLLTIQILICVSATSRTFAPNHDLAVHQQPVTNQSPESSPAVTIDTNLSSKEGMNLKSKIGSTPPSCEHKCYGCVPCEAIQVPTTSSHLGIQYANYEPEGWKCKCGPSLYTP